MSLENKIICYAQKKYDNWTKLKSWLISFERAMYCEVLGNNRHVCYSIKIKNLLSQSNDMLQLDLDDWCVHILLQASGAQLGTMLQNLANIGTGIIIGFVYGWQLTLVILAFIPIIGIAGVLQMQLLEGVSGNSLLFSNVKAKIYSLVLYLMSKIYSPIFYQISVKMYAYFFCLFLSQPPLPNKLLNLLVFKINKINKM